MNRGKYLVWLAIGSFVVLHFTLPFVEYSALDAIDDAKGGYAFSYRITWYELVWAILLYFLLRRQQWARWIAVVLWAKTGLIAALLGLFVLNLVFLSEGEHKVMRPWLPPLLLLLLVGLAYLVDAGILVFPESVGDFFARQNWNQAKVAVRVGRRIQGLKRDDLLHGLPGRRTMIKHGRRLVVVAVALCWILIFGGIFLIGSGMMADARNLPQQLEAGFNPTSFTEGFVGALVSGAARAAAILATAMWLVGFLVIGYLAVFVIPFLLALPFVLPFARRWRDPITFLVLRPFNKDRITAHLARFLRDDFAPFGHCYTLSDRKVRVPLHVRVPLLLGQLSFLNFRFRGIRQPKHIGKLVLAMQKRVRRNLNWCFSGTKLFPISCCDPGWRDCVTRLVQEVDVVVADLSSITENVVWELELLRDSGALVKTVFVVEESQATDAQERIAQLVGPSRTMDVVPYGPVAASHGHVARARIMDILCCDVEPTAATELISCC